MRVFKREVQAFLVIELLSLRVIELLSLDVCPFLRSGEWRMTGILSGRSFEQFGIFIFKFPGIVSDIIAFFDDDF